jgi:uncharacterized protein YacL (UPF0231 family)
MLDYEIILELKEVKENKATLQKRETVRNLQDHVISSGKSYTAFLNSDNDFVRDSIASIKHTKLELR